MRMEEKTKSTKSPEELKSETLKLKAKLVSTCMLENSMFFVVGCGVGLALGLQRKSLRPFVYSITLGTIGDMLYGYTMDCRPFIEDYQRAQAGITLPPKQPEAVPDTTPRPFFGIKYGNKKEPEKEKEPEKVKEKGAEKEKGTEKEKEKEKQK